MPSPITLTMSLPPIRDIELVALEGLDRLARHLEIPDEKIGEARILVTEALVNALEHAGRNSPRVGVEFTMTAEELVVFVEDTGKGFEPSAVQEPDILEKVSSKNKRGWGIKLMKSLSDDFHVESGPGGTKITLRKLLR